MLVNISIFAIFLGLASCSLVERRQWLTKEVEPTEEFQHNAVLDADELFHIFWNFNETHIIFEMHVQSTGWIGLGFSPSGLMQNADIVVGWVKDGQANVTDRHGPPDGNSYPPLDDQQNIELLYGEECDGWTVIKFRRQLAACEVDQDMEITADTMRIIYAYGDNDPVDNDITSYDYHGDHRGSKSMLLLDPIGSTLDFPEGETYQSFDLLNENFKVPANNTYYNCRLFEIPKFDKKHHLVKIEPIIQPGNELNVHHILIYQCSKTVTSSESIGANAQCYTSNMPDDFSSCQFVIQAWAIGGGAFYYPPHAGFELGTDDAPKYVVMETHYDNPGMKADIVDSSGLRFTYTPNLRTFDAGIMEVGHAVAPYVDIIPPNAQSFLDSGECSEACFDKAMEVENQQEANVFAVLLHSHLLGRSLTLKHVRNGTELAPIAQDKSYDFNFQETRYLPKERQVRRGDAMQMNCNYDSTGRTKITMGGLETTREMCLSFVYYYPKIKLTFCENSPFLPSQMKYFGIDKVEEIVPDLGIYADAYNLRVLAPEELAGRTVGDIIDEKEWNEDAADSFAEALHNMRKMEKCVATNGNVEVDFLTNPLTITEAYMEESLNCTEPSQDMPTSGTAITCQESSTSAQTTSPVTKQHFSSNDLTSTSAAKTAKSDLITSIAVETAPSVAPTTGAARINYFSPFVSCFALVISALVLV